MRFMSYPAELTIKRRIVVDALERIGGVSVHVHDTISVGQYDRYRNKAQFPVGMDGIGPYAPRSHRVCDIDDCLIQHEFNCSIIAAVREWMTEYTIVTPANTTRITARTVISVATLTCPVLLIASLNSLTP